MNFIWIVFISMGLLSCVNQPLKTEVPSVYVLGSIHSNMLDQPHNDLRDFVAALHFYKPTMILTEARPEFSSAVEATIDGGSEQSLVYAFAKESRVKVVPVDWHNDEYNLEVEKEESQMTPSLQKEIDPLLLQFRKVVQTGTFEQSQSPDTQNLIRRRYDILETHGIKTLRMRDSKICQNIKKLKLFNERVLIVFGLAHKYSLEDCIGTMGWKSVSLENWFNPALARNFLLTKKIKDEAVLTYKMAKKLLESRLVEGYYKTDIDNLKEKLVEFDLWIQKTSEL